MPPSDGYIWAATNWHDNAALIADCMRLGYLQENWLVFDATYGRGNWWNTWRPPNLIHLEDSDFRALPFEDKSFDAVTYDPPYVSPGGRKTTTIPQFFEAYGMTDVPKSPMELQESLIEPGMDEMYRIVKPKGFVLMKCKDYVSSGKLFLGTHHVLTHALELGFECVDRLEHIGVPGPQSQTRQVHARRNLSTMFVFRK